MGLLVCAWPVEAQVSNTDSLYAIWADTSNTPAARVEAFYQRFDPLVLDPQNPELLRWALGLEEVQQLTQEIGKTEYMGRFSFLECGKYLYITQEPQKAIPLIPLALKQSLAAGDYMTADVIMQVMDQHQMDITGLIPLVEKHLTSVNQDSKLIPVSLFPIYDKIGQFYYSTSQFLAALELFQRLLSSCEQNGLARVECCNALGLIGAIHSLIGNHEEAEIYKKQALACDKQINSASLIALSYTEMAMGYTAMGDHVKAQVYLDSALMTTDCDQCIRVKAIRVKAGIYNAEEKYERALQELLSVREYYETIRERNFLVGAYYSELASAYLGLQQYPKAINAAMRGIELSNDNLYGSLESYQVIYQAYLALGKYQSALDYYQKYIRSKDARTELRNSQQVTKQELAFQYEQKRLADSLQLVQQSLQQELVYQKEINRQKSSRNALMVLGLLALLVAIGMYVRYRFVQQTKAELEKKNVLIEAEKEKARASERSKQQFLANMSHEIRTPMNAIKGLTDILLRRDPKPEQMGHLSAIKESSNSLLVIINDILDLSKVEAGKIDLEEIPFSIAEVIGNVETIMQFKTEEKGLLLQSKLPNYLPAQVLGDPTRLHQILLNLVGNAIKFTEKGVVSIVLNAQLTAGSDHLAAQFCVSDTGVGIGKDRLEKIFDSFEQAYSDTSRKFGGTGLGLSISKKLVEIQEGKIWAESEKGKGSQFYVNLSFPIVQALAETQQAESTVGQLAAQLTGIRVLLVEDNTFNAIVAQEELEDAVDEVIVDVAENGAIAVEKLKTGNYDLVLMDVQMPIMNGYEATEKIRALDSNKASIPVIAMTANVMQEEVDRCFEAGMNDFIGKPFEVEDLIQKIHGLIIP